MYYGQDAFRIRVLVMFGLWLKLKLDYGLRLALTPPETLILTLKPKPQNVIVENSPMLHFHQRIENAPSALRSSII